MKWQIVVFVSISINLCANPSNPLVVQGEASFYGIGSQTLQIVAADTTVIHWEDFSIASNELTQFIQPDVTSTVFNHVMTGNPSQLLGHLKANGNVYLFNPNGVLVGKDGKVDTAGFFCSTLDVLNEKGQYSGDSKASIVNQGTILASSGDVILLSYCVDNQGSIEAPSGVVGLGAGERILIQTTGDERLLIQPQVTAGSMLENSGQIVALQAELKSAGTPFALAINHKGSIDALSLQETGGKIFLVAGEGTVNVTGAMHAQVKDEGGTVHVLGHTVKVFENAVIDASGKNGGGTVLIGGDYRGSNPEIPNAQFTLVTDNSQIRADALQSGDGGKVIIWADNTTGFYSTASARGGVNGGDGGLIEISGKWLDFRGEADRLAPMGKDGLLLLDPINFTISGADANYTPFPPFVIGQFPLTLVPTVAGASTINAATLVSALGTGDVAILSSGAAGADNGHITVSSAVSFPSSKTLTLRTNVAGVTTGNVIVNANINSTSGGTIVIDSSQDILINQATVQTNGSGTITMVSVRDILMGNIANVAPTVVKSTGTGTVTMNAGRDLILESGTNPAGQVRLGNDQGRDYMLSAGRHCNLIGHSATADPRIEAARSLSLTTGGDLKVQPNAGSSCYVQSGTGSFYVESTGTITLETGSFVFAPALDVATIKAGVDLLLKNTGVGTASSIELQNTTNGTIEVTRNFEITGNGTNGSTYLSCGQNDSTITVGGNLLMSNAARIDSTTTTGGLTVDVTGNISLSGISPSQSEFYLNPTSQGPLSISAGGNITLSGSFSGINNAFNIADADISLTAGNNFQMGDSTLIKTVGSGSVSVSAGGSITVASGAGVQANDGNMSLTAPVIQIGDSSHTATLAIDVFSITGTASLTASTGLEIFGGASTAATVTGNSVVIDSGALTLESGPNSGASSVIRAGSATANVAGDILFKAVGDTAVITTNGSGNIHITGHGNLSAFGGSGGDSPAGILANGTTNILFCQIDGDFILKAGQATTDGNAVIAIQGMTGDMTLIGRNYTLTGGDLNSAGIKNRALIQMNNGPMSITATGAGGIVLNGGTKNECISALNHLGQGDVFIMTTNLSLIASPFAVTSASAFIDNQHGGIYIDATGAVQMTSGNLGTNNQTHILSQDSGSSILELSCATLTMNAGSVSDSPAYISSSSSMSMSVNGNLNMGGGVDSSSYCAIISAGDGGFMGLDIGGDITLISNGGGALLYYPAALGGDFFLTGGGNASFISNGVAPAGIYSNGGNITSLIQGNYMFQGGLGFPFVGDVSAGIVANLTSGRVGNIVVSGSNFQITGGAGPNAFAGILNGSFSDPMGGGDGTIHVTATGPTGITLTGGNANNALAFILTRGNATTNDIDIQISSGNLTLNGSTTSDSPARIVVASGGEITSNVGGNIRLNGASTLSSADIFMNGDGLLLLQAGRNIEANDFSSVQNLGAGGLTLVVDNLFPSPPNFGNGAFIKASSATIESPGPVRIFTSLRPLNTIQNPLNSQTYIPGVEFANTDTEMWGTYYPHNSGFPFTIFYKNIFVNSNVIGDFSTATTEALRDWENYDRYIWEVVCFWVKSESDDKIKDVTCSESFHMLRREYRNYHTLNLP